MGRRKGKAYLLCCHSIPLQVFSLHTPSANKLVVHVDDVQMLCGIVQMLCG
jgi:hypothetical protein